MQIRALGFRNALYLGRTDSGEGAGLEPAGIGLMVDDSFAACLSQWGSDILDSCLRPTGPTLIMYPSRELLYSSSFPSEGELEGTWVFELPQYKLVGSGAGKQMAALHNRGNMVSRLQVEGTRISIKQEYSYASEEEKWAIVEQIIAARVDEKMRTLTKFITHNFLNPLNSESHGEYFVHEKLKNQETFTIATNNQTLSFTFKKQQEENKLQALALYDKSNGRSTMLYGRLCHDIPSANTYNVKQGYFANQDIHSYFCLDSRPPASARTCRNYFKQMANFSNKFISLSHVESVYQKLVGHCQELFSRIGLRYGQQIIQGTQGTEEDIQASPERPQARLVNREYNLQEAKAIIDSQISRKRDTQRSRNTLGRSPLASKYYEHAVYVESEPEILSTNRAARQFVRNSPRKYEYMDNYDRNREISAFEAYPLASKPDYGLECREEPTVRKHDRIQQIIRQRQAYLEVDQPSREWRNPEIYNIVSAPLGVLSEKQNYQHFRPEARKFQYEKVATFGQNSSPIAAFQPENRSPAPDISLFTRNSQPYIRNTQPFPRNTEPFARNAQIYTKRFPKGHSTAYKYTADEPLSRTNTMEGGVATGDAEPYPGRTGAEGLSRSPVRKAASGGRRTYTYVD